MAKIIVFALLGLAVIGFLGWMLGNPDHPRQLVQQQQDSRFPTTVITTGKTRLKPEILAAWIQRGTPSLLLVDTRPTDDFQDEHLQHAVNRPTDTLLTLHGLRRLPRHKPIILYGGNEAQNAAAVDVMRASGLIAFYLPGEPDRIPQLPKIDDDIATIAEAGNDNQAHIPASVDPASKAQAVPSVIENSGVTQITELTTTIRIGVLDDQPGL